MLPSDLERVTAKLFGSLNTPLSKEGLSALSNSATLGSFLKRKIDPRAYHGDSETFFKDYLVVSFLKKCTDLPLGVDRVQACRKTWYEAEKRNTETNARFTRFIAGQIAPSELASFKLLELVRNEFRRILGRAPNALTGSRFGPGATFNDRGRLTTVPDKMSSHPTVSSGARCLLGIWQETAWYRALVSDRHYFTDPRTVDADSFRTVPKTAFTDRGIGIGPSINIYFQLGVGAFIRRKRLDRIGIVLEEAQELHRRVARGASLTGSHATVDCSSASDLNASRMIQFMASDDWWLVLNALRTPFTLIRPGPDIGLPHGIKPIRWYNQKFSAMGNGYTFELETVVFLAAARVSCLISGCEAEYGRDIYVYGDDIIVPSGAAPALYHLLDLLGHVPNQDKSFADGPFRESCGGDFFTGVAVRPHFVKEYPREPQDWISLANGLRRMAFGSPESVHRWSYLRSSWFAALDQIPSDIRKCRGPEVLGDITIHDSEENWSRGRVVDCIGSLKVYAAIQKPLDWKHWTPQVQLASALYGVGSEGPLSRGSVAGYRLKWIPFS